MEDFIGKMMEEWRVHVESLVGLRLRVGVAIMGKKLEVRATIENM